MVDEQLRIAELSIPRITELIGGRELVERERRIAAKRFVRFQAHRGEINDLVIANDGKTAYSAERMARL